MHTKALPFSLAELERIAADCPTPFYLYDERGIRESARRLRRAFGWAPAFRNFFAVKATPNPVILALLREEGMGADCSSLAELLLAERAEITGESLMFTSNDTPAEEFRQARRLGALINLDALGHLGYLARHAGLPPIISFRYNPGPRRSGNAIIGDPAESKFGVTREQLFDGYRQARAAGVARFGLHTMVVSNELDARAFIATAEMLFELVAELSAALDIRFEFVNLGGGLGIPYRPEQAPVDLAAVSDGVRAAYERTIAAQGLGPLNIFMECGRFITGPHGYLISRVRHLKATYKHYAGLDATMANLMRPGMYGAYHHISVPAKERAPRDRRYDVTGSLCENNDKFAVDRTLPELDEGDLVVIHDAGAHGHAMGFNYNGKLRSAELLLREDRSADLIRRAETLDDYFATLDVGLPGRRESNGGMR